MLGSCQQVWRSTDRFQIQSGCRGGGKSEGNVKDSKILSREGRLMAVPWHGHIRKRNKFGEGWRHSKAFANGGLAHGKMGCPGHRGWESYLCGSDA